MKAVVQESYGPPEVLKIVEIEKPKVPEDGVLVRVQACSVNISDWYGMTGLFLARILGGLFKPKDTKFGADFAGVETNHVVNEHIVDLDWQSQNNSSTRMVGRLQRTVWWE